MTSAASIHACAVASLAAGGFCALSLAADLLRRPQPMWIMNLVWPLAASFGGPVIVGFYWRRGRAKRRGGRIYAEPRSTWVSVALGALHCGAGCALGDGLAEGLLLAFPGIAGWFGYGLIFHHRTFAAWGLDFVLALGFGVAFQYFALARKRRLGVVGGLLAAAKADVLSLSAWQVGMYGVMATGLFLLFPAVGEAAPRPTSPEFWFLMQGAMVAGFCTSAPVNGWLIRRGIKEAM